MPSAVLLALFLTAMVGAALALLAVDRRALTPVLATAALVVALGGYVAILFAL
ncbi:hypothetical protein [Streptomyces sp. NBC_01477]|uniref:hypothetical protein n=1 Tax=Streptomyces sp. NBC_01477 TaxID=2976015 RepID=UPI002E301128|nr:hypothetical protein [Streptomyces sp. NBC_01477]